MYYGNLEYVLGEKEGYNEGYGLDGATIRPVAIHYSEDLPAEFAETLESVVAEVSGSESVTLNEATSEELGILPTVAPETGVAVVDIVLPVAFIAVVLAATVVVWKRKEQY